MMGFTDLIAALRCCADSPEPRAAGSACDRCPYRFLGGDECHRRVVRGAAQYVDQLQTLLVMALNNTSLEVDE